MNHGVDRRAFLTSLLALLLARCAQVKVPGLGGFGGSGDEGGGGDLVGEADQFQKYVAYGSKNLLTALGEVGAAAGHREDAAHYAAAAATINAESVSPDDITKRNTMIVDSTFKPEDLQKVRSAEGRKQLTNSFIHFTIGSFADKK